MAEQQYTFVPLGQATESTPTNNQEYNFVPINQAQQAAPEYTFVPVQEAAPEVKPEPKKEEKSLFRKLIDDRLEQQKKGTQFTGDILKQFGAPIVGAIPTIPRAVEQIARGVIRSGAEGEVQNIMPSSVYNPALDTEQTLFGPETETQKAQRKLGTQRALVSIPEIPGLKEAAEIGHQATKNIQASVSPQGKKTLQGSTSKENIFKGEIGLGDNPTLYGYALQAANVFGSFVPIILGTMVTKNPNTGAIIGGGMAADEAASNAADVIGRLSDEQLAAQSPFYTQMIKGGASPEEARKLTVAKAAETGAALQGVVATFSDKFIGHLISGAFDKMLTKIAGKSILGHTVAGTALSMGEQALGETAEGVAANIGLQSVLPNTELGEGSAANLILGGLGGVGPGAARGYVAGVNANAQQTPPPPPPPAGGIQQTQQTQNGAPPPVPPITPAPPKPPEIIPPIPPVGTQEAAQTNAAPTDLGAMGNVVPGNEAVNAPAVPTPLNEKGAKVSALTARLVSRGIDEDTARQTAILKVESEEKERIAKEEAAANELPTYYPKEKETREQKLFHEFLDNGFDPDTAKQLAAAQVAEEKANNKLPSGIPKEKKSATRPVSPTTGASANLAQPTSKGVPTGLPTETERNGVVSPEQDVAGTTKGEGVEPAPVESNEPLPVQTEEERQALHAEQDKAINEFLGIEVPPETKPEEVVPETPAPKVETRGRKKKETTPEQQVAKEQTRKDQRKAADVAAGEAAEQITNLARAVQPLDENNFDTDEDLKTAQDNQRRAKNEAIRRLYALSRDNKNKPGQRAAEALKDPAVTKVELDNAKAAYEYNKKNQPSAMSDVSKVGKPQARFSGATNGAQAIAVIKRVGNVFERFIASRLQRFVQNVKFVVIEDGDPLPEQLQKPINKEAWDNARGLFIYDPKTKERTVYVRGISFGDDQGVNVITVLHELIHAATNNRIEAGLLANYLEGHGNSNLRTLIKDLNALMANAADRYEQLKAAGKLPEGLQRLVESTLDEEGDYKIFTLPHEFLAYGMSSPELQAMLKGMEGKRKSGFSGFVQIIMEALGIGKADVNAFTDLIDITDKSLSARLTTAMKVAIREQENFEPSAQNIKPGTLSKVANPDTRTLKEINEESAINVEKIMESRTAEEFAKNTQLAQIAADPVKLLPVLRRFYSASSNETKKALLNFATTDFLAEEWGKEVPRLKDVNKYIQSMHGMTVRLFEGAEQVSNTVFNIIKKTPSLLTALPDAALLATLNNIDPSVDRRDPVLNARYDALGPDGQRAYKAVRDFYEDMSALYSHLLDSQIQNLPLSSVDKNNLIVKLKAIYEVGNKINPYFALVRRGNYWLRIGGGEDRQMYMFQSQMERDKVADEFAARRRTPKEELLHDNEFQIGNDIRTLRQDSFQSSNMLTELFDLIDKMSLSNLDEEEARVERENLKDAIYQMYLMSMPEQKFRAKFINREGITGFSTDFMRNFSDSAMTIGSQLSRIKYAPQIRNSLSAAYDSVHNRPDLEPFVDEMRDRVNLELPNYTKESKVTYYSNMLANAVTRAAFIQYLSSASSAILQPMSVIQFSLPLLGARYGYLETAKEFGKVLNIMNAYGISTKNADGTITYTMPTIRTSSAVQKSPLDQWALNQMAARNVGQVTLTSELLARGKVSSEVSLSTVRKFGRNTWWALSGGLLMHSAERISQEMVYKMSFRLNAKNAKAKFRKTAAYLNAPNKATAMEAFEKANRESWVDQAVVDVHESLGNMGSENRPPILRNPIGKVLLQFFMFPLHTYTQLGKNFFKMIKPWSQEKRGEAAKIFFGQMGTTVLLGGLVGVPFALTALGYLSGMWRAHRDDMPDDLRDMDMNLWLTKVGIPTEIINMFGESNGKTIADILTTGVLNKVTGADFASRLGLTGLWLRDGRETRNVQEASGSFLTEHMGATVTQMIGYAKAIEAWKKGDYDSAIDALPASIRNAAQAYRYATEGAKDKKGDELLSKDAFSKGEILWQVIGFRSDLLADIQNTNFKIKGIEQRIANERNDILEKLDIANRNKNMVDYKNAFKELETHNRKYPWDEITLEQVGESINKRQEQRGKSWRGVNVSEKNAPYAVEAIAPSRLKATAKEQENRK